MLWIPDSGYWIPDSSTADSGFQKELDSIFFPGFNAFLRTSFSCSNLAVLKDVIRRHNEFVFFSIYKITGINVLQFRKGLWYNNEGDVWVLSTPQHRRKNKHRITAKSSKKT